jgi:hypothetical protein
MAGAINPQAILQMLKSKMGGAPGGGPPSGGDESLGPATREMQGADPEYALKLVNSLKKQIADMIPTLAFKAPAASRALVGCFKGLDAAIKELQQAQATMNAVGGGIKSSAVPQPQPPMGGVQAPDIQKSSGIGM